MKALLAKRVIGMLDVQNIFKITNQTPHKKTPRKSEAFSFI